MTFIRAMSLSQYLNLARHHSAFIGACFALIGTFHTVVILKHAAVLRTFLAYCSAKFAYIFGELGIHCHKPACFFTDAGTFHEHADALFPGFHIRFIQAYADAFMACLCASITCVYTFLILICGIGYNSHSASLLLSLMTLLFENQSISCIHLLA